MTKAAAAATMRFLRCANANFQQRGPFKGRNELNAAYKRHRYRYPLRRIQSRDQLKLVLSLKHGTDKEKKEVELKEGERKEIHPFS